jgi:hypothetical protein
MRAEQTVNEMVQVVLWRQARALPANRTIERLSARPLFRPRPGASLKS